MAFLIWIFFQMITSIINGLCFSIFSSLDYIARSIMLYTTQGISYMVFIIFLKNIYLVPILKNVLYHPNGDHIFYAY